MRPGGQASKKKRIYIHELINWTIYLILLDFSKAFDDVSHSNPLYKLRFHGPLFNWIKDYLSSGTQIVVLDGASSTPLEVISGVPNVSPGIFALFALY